MRRPVARPRGLTGAAVMFAAASACALASAAPAAASSGYGQLIVNPGTVSPGQTVSILGTCPNNGSPLTGVFSAAFDGGQASVSQGSVNFTGSATIAYGVSAGSYEVAAKCGPGSPMVVITVAAGGNGGGMTPPPTTPGGSSWSSSAPSAGMPHKYPSSPASLGNAGAGAMGGGMKTTKPASSASAGMSATAGAAAAAGSSVNATDPPVTSTGIVRVGLAGSGRSTMTTPIAAGAAAAIVITGAVGFLMFRRRRNTPGTHS